MNKKYYENKTVLITGAFGGFGKQFIFQLLKSGAKLVLSDLHSKPLSELFSSEQCSQLPNHWENQILGIITTDLANKQGCEKLFSEFKLLNSSLDIIIHNAGISFVGEFIDVPADLNEKIIALNLTSVVHLNQLFLETLTTRRQAHIIYLSSVAGIVGTPLGVAYSASKFGLRGFAMALSDEIKRFGIQTSIVYPFWAATSIMESKIFGNPEIKTMPNFFASKPEDVVSETLKGAAKGKMHIKPGPFSKLMWNAIRFWPIVARQQLMDGGLIKN